MNPFLSWILFLGISGTVYIAMRGVPCLTFFMSRTLYEKDSGMFTKKIRKRKRLDKSSFERAEKTEKIEQTPLFNHTVLPLTTPTTATLTAATATEMTENSKPVIWTIESNVSNVPLNKKNISEDIIKTKKQKQNAMKREKQKLLKARMEEERLRNLRQHQKTLEEERMKAQTEKVTIHTLLPRVASGEWTVVGARGNRHTVHVPTVIASTTS
ncbi:hypothetical protein PCANB_002545 [Pneumocystis canis]|nr:hypothetical protein PCK1_002616 [Pneumocystis canis]KAG5438825.1 hypothetical protein PCANB_002545 [Pneumocystis canis]